MTLTEMCGCVADFDDEVSYLKFRKDTDTEEVTVGSMFFKK